MDFIRETVSAGRAFFVVMISLIFTLLTLLDSYLYISLGFSLSVSLILALSRAFLYLPLSILFATYLTVLRNSIRITWVTSERSAGKSAGKSATTGIFSGVSAVFFTILGCPPCLFGLLSILSSVGFLSGGLLFYLLYLQPYAGIFFTLSVVVMLVGTYLVASSGCSVRRRGREGGEGREGKD